MKSDKLVEAFVTVNSTPQMQVEAFLRHINNTDAFVVDLTVAVFRLTKRERTFKELQAELTGLFLKRLGILGTLSAIISGLPDPEGPIEGIKNSIVSKACTRMGYKNPLVA